MIDGDLVVLIGGSVGAEDDNRAGGHRGRARAQERRAAR